MWAMFGTIADRPCFNCRSSPILCVTRRMWRPRAPAPIPDPRIALNRDPRWEWDWFGIDRLVHFASIMPLRSPNKVTTSPGRLYVWWRDQILDPPQACSRRRWHERSAVFSALDGHQLERDRHARPARTLVRSLRPIAACIGSPRSSTRDLTIWPSWISRAIWRSSKQHGRDLPAARTIRCRGAPR